MRGEFDLVYRGIGAQLIKGEKSVSARLNVTDVCPYCISGAGWSRARPR